MIFFPIHKYYRTVDKNLPLESFGEPHRIVRSRVMRFPEMVRCNALQMNTAALLRKALIEYDVVIMDVPYYLNEEL